MSFRNYLAQMSQVPLAQVRHFIIGNTSVDYDSFFGSVLLAYFLTRTTSTTYIPLIDCPKNELPLRFEVAAVLEKLQISPDLFTFRESIPNLHPEAKYSLYDHNDRKIHGEIEYVIDHHAPTDPLATKIIITKMGSALTMVYYLLNPSKFHFVRQQASDHDFAHKY